MTIELPDDIADAAVSQAAAAGYATVAEYLASLVEEQEPILHPDTAELKALLDVTKGQVGVPVDDAYWEARRAEMYRRLAARASA